MTRYFFDVRQGDCFNPDAEGQEIPTSDAAWMEAARSLAELARETIPRHSGGHRIAIEVRNDSGPVLAVRFAFATEPKPSGRLILPRHSDP
jgi:hypothetical protein